MTNTTQNTNSLKHGRFKHYSNKHGGGKISHRISGSPGHPGSGYSKSIEHLNKIQKIQRIEQPLQQCKMVRSGHGGMPQYLQQMPGQRT